MLTLWRQTQPKGEMPGKYEMMGLPRHFDILFKTKKIKIKGLECVCFRERFLKPYFTLKKKHIVCIWNSSVECL